MYKQMAPRFSKTRPLMVDRHDFGGNDEEQSTSKPQIEHSVVRNPTFQASLLQKEKHNQPVG